MLYFTLARLFVVINFIINTSMKRYYYLLTVALVLTAILPTIVSAEETTVSTNADTQTTVGTPPRPATPILKQLREKTENIQSNEEMRNKLLNNSIRVSSSTVRDIRAMSSTTMNERKEIRDDRREEVGNIRMEGREKIKNASSSDERKEMRKEMRKDVFEVRKNAFIKQLNLSIENLKQIRERIASRIEKATSNGKDMTKPKALLVIADAKIAAAELAVNEIVAFDPSSSLAATADANGSTTIDLTKPREIGEKAIKAIKEAHRALVDVVRAIAHALGNGANATTTTTTTTTTSTSTTI